MVRKADHPFFYLPADPHQFQAGELLSPAFYVNVTRDFPYLYYFCQNFRRRHETGQVLYIVCIYYV